MKFHSNWITLCRHGMKVNDSSNAFCQAVQAVRYVCVYGICIIYNNEIMNLKFNKCAKENELYNQVPNIGCVYDI